MSYRILQGDVLERLGELAEASVHAVVTSPPYWGLRDYGTAQWEGGDPACDHANRHGLQGATGQRADRAFTGAQNFYRDTCARCGATRIDRQLGLERTPEEYVERMVAVFREVRRVLRDDATCWLNIGDSYANDGKWGGSTGGKHVDALHGQSGPGRSRRDTGLKPKDLCMIPARLALALQADGWWLRADIIWAKGISFCSSYSGSVMPESVTDRPTTGHEHVFLLTKAPTYFYDAEAVKEQGSIAPGTRAAKGSNVRSALKDVNGRPPEYWDYNGRRNLRSVWAIGSESFPGAHFATYPCALVEPCIKAGTSERGCCPACGAPWQRVTGEPESTEGRGSGNKARKVAVAGERSRTNTHLGSSVPWAPTVTPTVGWTPTCACPPGEPIPCTVLDPFGGAMTTALVAERLGRDSISIELNPAYVEMGERRIVGDAPLFYQEQRA